METHIVDESLKDKLKCLIFIPIISQTYCDSKVMPGIMSFVLLISWQRKTGLEEISDLSQRECYQAGYLPVKIHDLDPEDKTLLENEIGGVLKQYRIYL